MIHFLPVVALAFYLLSLALLGAGKEERLRRWGTSALFLGCLSHLVSFLLFFNFFESHLLAGSMSAAALLTGLSFFCLRNPKKLKFTRPLLFLVIVLYLSSSALLHQGGVKLYPPKSVSLLWSHVAITLFGLISFLAAGFLALGHIWQARALKSKSPTSNQLDKILGKLPSLRELSSFSLLAEKVGLFLTVIGLYLGFLYNEDSEQAISPVELKLILPTLLVVFYAILVSGRGKLSETTFVKLSAFGVILSITSIVVAAVR